MPRPVSHSSEFPQSVRKQMKENAPSLPLHRPQGPHRPGQLLRYILRGKVWQTVPLLARAESFSFRRDQGVRTAIPLWDDSCENKVSPGASAPGRELGPFSLPHLRTTVSGLWARGVAAI